MIKLSLQAGSPPGGPRRLRVLAPLALAATGAALSITGCGGANNTTTGSPASPRNGADAAYRFASCMRNHGVSDFPDPKVTQNGNQVQVAIAVTPAITDAPQFKTAQAACAGILPGPVSAAQQAQQQHQRAQKLLAFARCMRSHNVSNFPDPSSQGQLPLETIRAAGVNVAAPFVQAAAIECIPSAGGLLNAAQVRAAATESQGGGSGSQSGSAGSQ